MNRLWPRNTAVVSVLGLLAFATVAYAAEVKIAAIGGFIRSDAHVVETSGARWLEFGREQLGLEVRLTSLTRNTSLYTSYSIGGVIGEGDPTVNPRALELQVSTQSFEVGVGLEFGIGNGVVGPQVGLVYVWTTFETWRRGVAQPRQADNQLGLALGGRIAAPLSKSFDLLFEYEYITGSSISQSGRLTDGEAFELTGGGASHVFLAGISYTL